MVINHTRGSHRSSGFSRFVRLLNLFERKTRTIQLATGPDLADETVPFDCVGVWDYETSEREGAVAVFLFHAYDEAGFFYRGEWAEGGRSFENEKVHLPVDSVRDLLDADVESMPQMTPQQLRQFKAYLRAIVYRPQDWHPLGPVEEEPALAA